MHDGSHAGDRASNPGERSVHVSRVQSGFGRLRILMPERFSGHGQDNCTEWVLSMCRWLRGNAVDESRWLAIMFANLSSAAPSWMNMIELQVHQGQRVPFATWSDFTSEVRGAFEPATLAEQARRRVHSLR